MSAAAIDAAAVSSTPAATFSFAAISWRARRTCRVRAGIRSTHSSSCLLRWWLAIRSWLTGHSWQWRFHQAGRWAHTTGVSPPQSSTCSKVLIVSPLVTKGRKKVPITVTSPVRSCDHSPEASIGTASASISSRTVPVCSSSTAPSRVAATAYSTST
ncbi:MAG: hypothetical protein IPM94_00520 [bacterium]|nr:hypothetical protein [bacterium]